MTVQVLHPYQIFADRNGAPLQNGYIYIGTLAHNPESSPVAVYWDAALTLPAVQPIRTINGMPSNNGSPALLYTSTTYSITIRDSSGALVLTSLNGSTLTPIVDYVSGISGTNTITGNSTISAYTVGTIFEFTPAGTNTGPVTINWNSLGAGALQFNGAALSGGELVPTEPVLVTCTSATPTFELLGKRAIFSTASTTSTNLTGIGNAAAFDARYAALAGLATQVFAVATPTGTTHATPRGYFEAIDNSAAGTDTTLQVGQTAFVDFSASSSIPLHIACGDNQKYELTIEANGSSVGAATGICYLYPNNTTYAAACVGQYTTATGAAISGALSGADSALIISAYAIIGAKCEISTKTLYKELTGSAGLSLYNGATYYQVIPSSLWNDTTTAWTSLGTVTLNVAQTGRIYIKRIA